ncbi:MAG TPA: hypothetical protein IGS53_25900 [Leptolyngbyaceae cyanobacterium M33_DOE_097]|uniref:Uncharacterized protein n=1 Tax=Oscillatoriales cyanobacterium SpSt-418 TaxID=2282169 RepID=A0A7C3KJI3_9CYAN|nr:hypothetical protein [Leptolyngbyaceae cyanobacterium M33_DOE_097]
MHHSTASTKAKRAKFISLRFKLLVGFTVVYSIVFATAYGWFYRYSTDRAMERIQKDLVNTLSGAHPEVGGVRGGLARIEEDTKKGHPVGAPQSIKF